MNLWERLRMLLRVALNDLLGETAEPGTGGLSTSAQDRLLADSQAQVDALKAELVEAVARDKRLEIDLQRLRAETTRADAAVDEALRAGQDDQARRLLAEARRLQADTARQEARWTESREVTARMQAAFREFETHLAAARRQMHELAEVEHNTSRLEDLEQVRRSLRQDMAALQDALDVRRETASRRGDKLAARQDLDKRQ